VSHVTLWSMEYHGRSILRYLDEAMRSARRALLLCGLLAGMGCDGRPALRVVPRDGGLIQRGDAALTVATTACPPGQSPRTKELGQPVKLDLLFLVDDSPSMAEEQANLARNFPRLIAALTKMPDGFPDLHLGVVSSDLGAGLLGSGGACTQMQGKGGLLQVPDGCGIDASRGRFLFAPAVGSPGNYRGDLADAFACLARLGTTGCGFEHQLEAVRLALSGFVSGNQGFLRPDAHLAVVYITDEDDCSAPASSTMYQAPPAGQDGSLICSLAGHRCNGSAPPAAVYSTPLANCSAAPDGGGKLIPVASFVDEMRRLQTRSVSVSVIGGWPADPDQATYAIGYDALSSRSELLSALPICRSANGSAAVGLRLQELVAAFGSAGRLISICQDDFSAAMAQVGDLINTTVQCE
jgi:hypothetical protein